MGSYTPIQLGAVHNNLYTTNLTEEWSNWVTLGTGGEGVKIKIDYYALNHGILVSKNIKHYYIIFNNETIKIRHNLHKLVSARSAESEIDWGDGMVTTYVFNAHYYDLKSVTATISQTCSTSLYTVTGDVEYLVLGY